MFDARLRLYLEPPLARVARRLDRGWLTPDRLTMAGLAVGLSSAFLAAQQAWTWAVVTWLISRLVDGLDGPLARHRSPLGEGSPAGGFLDITADFCVYGATVLGVGIGATHAQAGDSVTIGQWLPFAAVLLAYYLNGAAFLAFSSIAERTGLRLDDGRSLNFLGGLAEGAETIAVHSLWLLIPLHAPLIAAVWAGVVTISALSRMLAGYRMLSTNTSGPAA